MHNRNVVWEEIHKGCATDIQAIVQNLWPFVFTSFDYIAYTIQQAEDFITQNNIYYKSEDEKQALISQITTYLAKSN